MAIDLDILTVRIAPQDDPETSFFWASGEDGKLRFKHCQDCGYYSHPPTPRCPRCLSANMQPDPVSGKATVLTYTVNIQQWVPGQAPYIIAIVTMEEQDDLRLTTLLAGVDLEDPNIIGMKVEVRFLARDDVWYPTFVPEGSPA
ncbi:MAG: OB-fold domain-containing protein [Actinomycetota bacterium]|nr:OB-fold domain-containing protein [Actinomycetota bacterium]